MGNTSSSVGDDKSALSTSNDGGGNTFRFELLPTEVQVEIIKLAVTTNKAIWVSRPHLEKAERNNSSYYLEINILRPDSMKLRPEKVGRVLTPAILRTNQAAHRNGGNLLYQANRFRFQDPPALAHFVKAYHKGAIYLAIYLANVEIKEMRITIRASFFSPLPVGEQA